MRESGRQINSTHNPFRESHWVSRVRENCKHGSYGEGLETDQDYLTPRQSFTRQLFFRWIKQNLRVKSFLGTSFNAVMTQLWVALCAYLVLAFLKFQSKLRLSMQQMLRLLQLNLFERRDFIELFSPPKEKLSLCDRQLSLI